MEGEGSRKGKTDRWTSSWSGADVVQMVDEDGIYGVCYYIVIKIMPLSMNGLKDLPIQSRPKLLSTKRNVPLTLNVRPLADAEEGG